MATTRVTPYGLKEVADVRFYPVGTTVTPTWDDTTKQVSLSEASDPKFIFDTLKVSNIEISAEEATATGGKGNAELISWSYGKEITLTMEDAVFNMSTIDLLFGGEGGTEDSTDKTVTIKPESFNGYYKIVGYTYIRNKKYGNDEGFVFTIEKGKVNLGGTLTMEADGDPSTFEMTVKALKAEDGSLIKFERLAATASPVELDSNITTT